MRVGILRPDRLGDTVVTLPVAGLVKREVPGARVVWITREPWRELLSGHPWVDEVTVAPAEQPSPKEARAFLQRLSLDVLILAFSKPGWAWASWRAGIPVRVGPDRLYGRVLFTHRARWTFDAHMVERGHRLVAAWLGRPPEPLLPVLPVDPRIRETVWSLLPPSPRVVIHPETGGTARTWPMDRFRALAEKLNRAGIHVVWTGKDAGADPGVGTDLRGRLSLKELVATLSLADGVVVPATGVFHLAWALSRPVVALMDARHRRHVDRWGSLHPATVHLDLTDTAPSVETVFHWVMDLLGRRSA